MEKEKIYCILKMFWYIYSATMVSMGSVIINNTKNGLSITEKVVQKADYLKNMFCLFYISFLFRPLEVKLWTQQAYLTF